MLHVNRQLQRDKLCSLIPAYMRELQAQSIDSTDPVDGYCNLDYAKFR